MRSHKEENNSQKKKSHCKICHLNENSNQEFSQFLISDAWMCVSRLKDNTELFVGAHANGCLFLYDTLLIGPQCSPALIAQTAEIGPKKAAMDGWKIMINQESSADPEMFLR